MNKIERILDLYRRFENCYEIVHGARTEAAYYGVSPSTIQGDIKIIRGYLRERAIKRFEVLIKNTNGELDKYVHYIEEERIEYNRLECIASVG